MQALPPPPPAIEAPLTLPAPDRSEATTGELRVAAALTDARLPFFDTRVEKDHEALFVGRGRLDSLETAPPPDQVTARQSEGRWVLWRRNTLAIHVAHRKVGE